MHSIIKFVGDGRTIRFPLTFTLGYLRREYVSCRVGVEIDSTGNPLYRNIIWDDNDPNWVTISGAIPAVGVEIVFTRTVPVDALLYDFQRGAHLSNTALNESHEQLMMAVHEMLDAFIVAVDSQDKEITELRKDFIEFTNTIISDFNTLKDSVDERFGIALANIQSELANAIAQAKAVAEVVAGEAVTQQFSSLQVIVQIIPEADPMGASYDPSTNILTLKLHETSLPAMTPTVRGGARVGAGLVITDTDVLNVIPTVIPEVPIATNTVPGIVRPDNSTLTVDSEGVLSTKMYGTPVGFEAMYPATAPPAGWLDESVYHAPIPRTTYPELWAMALASGNLLDDVSWQAQVTANGTCGAFSTGNGSTTFRIPLIRRVYMRARDPQVGDLEVGQYQNDAQQRVTGGLSNVYGADTADGAWLITGSVSAGWTAGTNVPVAATSFDSSRQVRTANEVRVKTIVRLPIIKAFDALINAANVDVAGLVTQLGLTNDRIAGAENRGQLGQLKRVNGAGTSIDTYTQTGDYWFVDAEQPGGWPLGTNGLLVVKAVETPLVGNNVAPYVKQFVYRYGAIGSTDHEIAYRTLRAANGVWGPWYRLDNGIGNQVMHVQDEKANNVAGGTFTAGAWRTRDLNSVVVNSIPGASLSNNRITLPVGTYYLRAEAPANNVNANVARLYNVTENTIVTIGSSCVSGDTYGGDSQSIVIAYFGIERPMVFEIQHYCASTRNTIGFGSATPTASGVPSIFTQCMIRRIS